MHVIDEIEKLDKFEVRLRGSATEFNKIKPTVNFIRDLDYVCERKRCEFEFTDGVGYSNNPKEANPTVIHSDGIRFCTYGQMGVFTEGRTNLRECLEGAYYALHDREESLKIMRLPNCNAIGSNYSFVTISCRRLAVRIDVVNGSYHESHENSTGADFVEGIRCQNFPELFSEFFSRERKFGWPSGETIKEIINTGCELIARLEPNEYLFENKTFWTVSFSNAERILINSWTNKQQTVYHMLRNFIVIEFAKNGSSFVNAHTIKLVMFWKCEETPEKWWSENSVIDLCRELLEGLRDRIATARFDDYFLPDLNKLDFLHDEIMHLYHKEVFDLQVIRECCFSFDKLDRSSTLLKEYFNKNYYHPVSSNINAGEGIHERSQKSTDRKCGNKLVIPEIPEKFCFWSWSLDILILYSQTEYKPYASNSFLNFAKRHELC